jgi:hypothetical protein
MVTIAATDSRLILQLHCTVCGRSWRRDIGTAVVEAEAHERECEPPTEPRGWSPTAREAAWMRREVR